jgi:predicted phosphodiesterase
MIGIISDIHGNHVALLAVLGKLNEMGVSEIVCLGDVSGYYCQINECCEALRSRNIFSLRGNHDWYLATGEGCPRSSSANVCLGYQRQAIFFENLDWLRSLPSGAEKHGIRMVHGGWNDPIDEYLKPSEEYFSKIPGRYFASGHTHVQRIWSGGGKTYCNPGSVGQPRDGNPRAAFATWADGSFALHRVNYDVSLVQKKMAMAGFDSYFYENLSRGAMIGGRIEAP